ncbi:ATP-binding Cassette (ABC) Superfamily [Thraustotheca clavata]|uniref:ATP-binding Cassette (ABC) Superfamily n=1 Tax=Thraustotheca clavata TaxID=74557 RepID=A0A1V9ZD88_9STRA|nr:ATP-binding Cassette (ABC) Superfamily [Thraustotheca clavata]
MFQLLLNDSNISTRMEKTPLLTKTLANTCPEEQTGCSSTLFFSWVTPLMEIGSVKPLDFDDLYQLDRCNRAESITSRFEYQWNVELKKTSPSLPWALAKAFGIKFMMAGMLRFVRSTLLFVAPFVIKETIAFLRDENAPNSKGYALVALIFVSGIFSSFCFRQYAYYCRETGLQIRTALVTYVYAKSLRLSTQAQQERSTGEITNLISIDTSRLQRLTMDLHTVWVVPYLLLIACSMLYQELGISFIAGIAVVLLVIPISFALSRVMGRLQKALMLVKDQRVKLCYEVLAGIKVIKLQAWELSFTDRVLAYRDDELSKFTRYIFTKAASSAVYNGVPALVAVASFTAYISMGLSLDVSTALTSLSLFNVLRFPLFKLPQVVNSCVEAMVSVRRLESFFLDEERNEVTAGTLSTIGISIENADFSVGINGPSLLNGVLLSMQNSGLVAVVGAVGSGKSTLLKGVLGDVYCNTGNVYRKGSVAYVAQQPFIQNATLRENICFGLPFDASNYDRVLAVSCLTADIAVLPHGDRTEIGEKGINLSGGQRTRVALARAMYQDADIYLLDDILAAVDSHVGADIFRNCILDLLRNKVVVLVTNQLGVLNYCNHLIVLNEGSVIESGSFSELINKDNGLLHSMFENFMGGSLPSSEVEYAATTLSNEDSSKDVVVRGVAEQGTEKIMTVEDRAVGHVTAAVYLTWLRACGGIIWGLIVCLVYIAAQALTLAATIWLSYWSEHNDRQSYYLTVFVLLNGGYLLFLFFRSIAIYLFGLKGARKLFASLLTAIIRAPIQFFDTTPLGRIVNRLSKDVYTTDEDIPASWGSILTTALGVFSTVVTIVYVTPIFALLLVPIAIYYLRAQRYFIASSRELQRLDSISRSPILALMTETLDGLPTIRAYNVQSIFGIRLSQLLDRNQRAYLANFAVNCWLGLRLEFVGTLIASSAALSAVIMKPYATTSFPGLVGVSLSYAFQITRNLQLTVTTVSELETEMVSVERIDVYAKLDHEAELRSFPALTDWPSAGAVVFQNVCLKYRPGLPLVLSNVTFSIKPCEKIGVVGRTGAGKSSLVVALLRLAELESGKILLDGVDISKVGLHDVRENIAIIPQDPVLFSGTVRSNLDPFNMYDDNSLWTSLKRAHLTAKVTALEDSVDERGCNFSVGERQLLCIARALLQKSKILVMDEATASIDAATDSSLQATLRQECIDCTCITIAHRINTIMDADRILVMDHGTVAEFDTPAILLAISNGIFSDLVAHWRDDSK